MSVDDRIRLDDQSLRRWMVFAFVGTFLVGDVLTLGVIGGLLWLDQTNLKQHLISPDGRIITPQAVMALLGTTTVQTDTIAAIIARYLFPGRRRGR